MKRILALAFALVMVLAVLAGCTADFGKLEGEQNPSQNKNSTHPLNPPVPGEIVDLHINSIDKLNYYAAIRVLAGTLKPENQSSAGGSYGISWLASDSGQDTAEEPPVPETANPEETEGPPVASNPPSPTESEEKIYYYELDPNQPFLVSKVSMFQMELTDENGFLADKLGCGVVDVVITEDCIWGDSLITFRNGENFFSCLTNGWSLDQETGGCRWEFSTHKYVEGFNIVKNFEQENYAFYVSMDADGQVTAFECQASQNGGDRPDRNVIVFSSTAISTAGGSFTIAELENYFNDDSAL